MFRVESELNWEYLELLDTLILGPFIYTSNSTYLAGKHIGLGRSAFLVMRSLPVYNYIINYCTAPDSAHMVIMGRGGNALMKSF